MKFSVRIKSGLVALILSLSMTVVPTYPTDVDTTAAPSHQTDMDKEALINLYKELNAAIPEKIDDEFAKLVEELINLINCIFGDLACLIQEDAIQILDKEKKSALLKEITQTRQAINTILKNFINRPSKAQLDYTLSIINLIMQQLEEALKGDFSAYKAFDMEQTIKRMPDKAIEQKEIAELKDTFKTTQEYCKSVQKKSENAGLHWYNHVYRNTVDRFIVQPSEKYSLHQKALYTSAGFAAFCYLWFKLNDSYSGLTPEIAGLRPGTDMAQYQLWNKDSPQWKRALATVHDYINYGIRKYCGWEAGDETSKLIELQGAYKKAQTHYANYINEDNVPSLGKLGAALTEVSPLKDVKWLGKLDQQGHRIAYSWWTPFMTALYIPFKDEVHAKYKEVTAQIDKGVKKWHYWAKGGAYYQRYKYKKDSFRIEPRFTFDDIIGLDHAKQVLGDIVKYIEDPERYERAGLTPAMGYLLFGPTRTGKSMIAEGLAGELQRIKGSSDDFPFFSIEARYIAAEGNFNYVMNLIKNYAPCIIFIDEIDLLNLHRKFQDKNVLLSEFLSTISGCMNNNPDKQVIIIAATNKPDDLDPSLRSRLSVHIPFEYPSFAHRGECIIRELEGKGLPLNQFDIRKLAEQTEGCSYQQLHEVINNAQFTTRETGKPVTQADIERSLNTEIRNIIYHDYKDLSQDELDTLSIHMSGHALAYMLVEGKSEQLSQVTIRPVKLKIEDESQWKDLTGDKHRPIIQYGHIFTHLTGDSLKFMSRDDIKRKCMIEIAGRIAEEIILGTYYITKDSCSCHDKARAFHWAKRYFLDGLDERLLEGSKAMQNKIVEQSYEFLAQCEQEMRTLLESHRDLILFLSDGLKKMELLGVEELQALVDLHKTMGGTSIDELIQKLQEQGSASEQILGTTEEAMTAEEVRNAMQHELGIVETAA